MKTTLPAPCCDTPLPMCSQPATQDDVVALARYLDGRCSAFRGMFELFSLMRRTGVCAEGVLSALPEKRLDPAKPRIAR